MAQIRIKIIIAWTIQTLKTPITKSEMIGTIQTKRKKTENAVDVAQGESQKAKRTKRR